MIPYLSEREAPKNGSETGFPIRHPDLSIDNIFVDDDCNITCIIDWEFASSVPTSELLITPGLPHPRNRLDPSLVDAFRAGFANHFLEEGKPIHHSFWDKADKIWHFLQLVNLDALQDYNHFRDLYASVLGSPQQKENNIPIIFRQQQQQNENEAVVSMAKILSSEDRPEEKIKRDEDAYFSAVGSERRAVSTMLTIASELNQGFVADRRLWQWLEDVYSLIPR